MCLVPNTVRTKNMQKKTGVFTAYKVYEINEDGEVRPPFQGGSIEKPGIIRSNRERKTLIAYEKEEGVVELGIHVFLKKKDALEAADSGDRYVFSVECDIKNLVAVGTWDTEDRCPSAVFTKIKLPKAEWDRVYKRWKKNAAWKE